MPTRQKIRRRRRTKIVATLGPSSSTEEMLQRLFLAGADVFRLNFSHGTHEDHAARIRERLRLQYGAAELQEARMPASIKAALSGYFKGDLDALKAIEWRIAGTAFQQKVWKALPKIPAGNRFDRPFAGS